MICNKIELVLLKRTKNMSSSQLLESSIKNKTTLDIVKKHQSLQLIKHNIERSIPPLSKPTNLKICRVESSRTLIHLHDPLSQSPQLFQSDNIMQSIKIQHMGTIPSLCCESEKQISTSRKIRTKKTSPGDRESTNIVSHIELPNQTYDSQQFPVQKDSLNKNTSPLIGTNISATPPKLKKSPSNSKNNVIQIKSPSPSKIHKKIKADDFTYSHLLGAGGFAKVFLGELKTNKKKNIGKKYVIKMIQKQLIIASNLVDSILLEKKILLQCTCPFIIKLYSCFRDTRFLYIVMEWASGGDTYSLIHQDSNSSLRPNSRLTLFKKSGEQTLRFILGCVILGLEFLHAQNILYRDLKPENLLIFQNGYVKLADFGLATQLKGKELPNALVGTELYYPPQMVLFKNYGKQVDLWALGVYSYEMSNFCPPFTTAEIMNESQLKNTISAAQKKRNWRNKEMSNDLKDFINKLLKFEPKERLGAKGWKEVKSHRFFTSVGFDWKQLEQTKMISPLKSIIEQNKLEYSSFQTQYMTHKDVIQKISKQKDPIERWTQNRTSTFD